MRGFVVVGVVIMDEYHDGFLKIYLDPISAVNQTIREGIAGFYSIMPLDFDPVNSEEDTYIILTVIDGNAEIKMNPVVMYDNYTNCFKIRLSVLKLTCQGKTFSEAKEVIENDVFTMFKTVQSNYYLTLEYFNRSVYN